MARLLQETRSRNVMPHYIDKLLNAFSIDMDFSVKTILPEPLTSREKDVLQLMVAGLTNLEIGEELVISPQTVKKHAGNIYGKLGSNRTEAATKAIELKLLD
jgi:DNA-binding NarL/FixJ family response regulator